MNPETTEQERVVLRLLEETEGPVGAGTVRERLSAEGISASEATVGRLLRDLDRRGLTSRVGFQGRVLTEQGSSRLAELRAAREQVASAETFIGKIFSANEKTLLDLLETRKAVERQIARLAAEKGGSSLRKELGALAGRLAGMGRSRSLHPGEYRAFFLALAKTAGNDVLSALEDLLLGSDAGAGLTGGDAGRLAGELGAILDAVAGKDPDAAEDAAARHIDGMLGRRRKGKR